MEAMLLKKIPDHIQWEGYLGDFSELSNLKDLMQKWNENPFKVDLIFHSIGIIFPKKKKTKEDIEINFATSFLSRFYPTKLLHQKNFISNKTLLMNIAASSEKVSNYLKLDFSNFNKNDKRFGMSGHGQAQLANDLWVVEVAKRYNIATLGAGPGSVKTNIRREIPNFLEYLIAPFFILKRKTPAEVSSEL